MADRRTLFLPVISVLLYVIGAEDNKYYMMSPCITSSILSHYLKIDGAVIQRGNYLPLLDCTMRFKAGRMRKFMVHIENLTIKDCNEHLQIFDENFSLLSDLNCNTRLLEKRTVVTPTEQVILRYVSGSSKSKGSSFRLVLTAFKESVLTFMCDFRCQKGDCIDDDLLCDKVNHCGDNSDEQRCINVNDSAIKILGLGISVFIVIVVCIFVVCSICIIGFFLCLCRKKQSHRSFNNVSYQTSPTATATPVPTNTPYPKQPGYPYIPPNAYTYQPDNPPPYPGGVCPFPQQQTVMYDVNQDQIYYPKQ